MVSFAICVRSLIFSLALAQPALDDEMCLMQNRLETRVPADVGKAKPASDHLEAAGTPPGAPPVAPDFIPLLNGKLPNIKLTKDQQATAANVANTIGKIAQTAVDVDKTIEEYGPLVAAAEKAVAGSATALSSSLDPNGTMAKNEKNNITKSTSKINKAADGIDRIAKAASAVPQILKMVAHKAQQTVLNFTTEVKKDIKDAHTQADLEEKKNLAKMMKQLKAPHVYSGASPPCVLAGFLMVVAARLFIA